MKPNAQERMEQYIEALRQGELVNGSVKNHAGLSPADIERLRIAEKLNTLRAGQVPTTALEKSRSMMLSQAAALGKQENLVSNKTGKMNFLQEITGALAGLRRLSPAAGRLIIIIGITALLLVFSGGLVVTSAKSLPGEPLYRVKRVVEEIEIQLVPGSENKHEFEESFNQERMGEVLQLINQSRVQQISFEGVLEEVNEGQWIVNGIPVIIQDSTIFVSGSEVSGAFIPGSIVEIEGSTTREGAVSANEVHLREYLYLGIVEQIGQNSWIVSGTGIITSRNTKINEDIKVGDRVAIWMHSTDNGSVAVSIEKEDELDATQENEPVWHPTEGKNGQADEPEAGEATTFPVPHDTQTGGEPGEDDHATVTPAPKVTDESPTQTVTPDETEEYDQGTASPEFEYTPEPTDGHGD